MSKRVVLPLAGLALVLTTGLAVRAQDSKDPEIKYALDLRARKASETEFSKTTKKYGVEIYIDGHNSNAIYLSEAGALSVIPSKQYKGPAAKAKVKDPSWKHGLRLNVRKAGEKDWDKSRAVGFDVHKDENAGGLVYINESGYVGTVPSGVVVDKAEKDKVKAPKWQHAMELRVRKAGEADFTKDTRKLAVEVFKDENNGNLVYVTQTGYFAVVPGKHLDKEGKGDPEHKQGLELTVRKAGEKDVTKDTKKFGVEVFVDPKTGCQIYIAETGAISVLGPSVAKIATDKADPEFKHAMDLSVRKAGEKDWDKAKKFGVEVYAEKTTGNTIYIAETGDIAVVSGK